MRERSRAVGVRVWLATLVASVVFAAWSPSVLSVLAAVAVLAAGALLRAGREGWAFTATAAAMAATLSSLFVDLFPNVLISSTDAAYNLTVSGAASGSYALKVMTVAAADLRAARPALPGLDLPRVPRARPRLRVAAAAAQQLGVGAALDDAAGLEHDDLVHRLEARRGGA